MSEGEVSRLTVGKDKGGDQKSKQLRVAVTASIITTTTRLSLHAENQTRVFDLHIDDSEALTRQVLRRLGAQAAGRIRMPAHSELKIWHEALKQLEAQEVSVPFGPYLAEAFPAELVRARRDFQRALRLVEVIALLHQQQRDLDELGRVVATVADYQLAYPLLQAVLEPSMTGLGDKALAVCDLHDELAGEVGGWVWRIDLERAATQRKLADRKTVHDWCRRLSDRGIFDGELQAGKWRHRRLRDPREEPIALPRPEDLPGASQSGTGRQKPSNDGGISAPPNETERDTGGLRAPIGLVLDLSLPDWEVAESSRPSRGNGSHPPIWEDLGGAGCSWCGEVRATCGFCEDEGVRPCSA